MKYNIYINQLVLADTELDLVDCAILDYLYFIDNSKNDKIESQRINGFTWVDYGKIIDDNPLLRIKSKGAITPRIKRIEKAGFIIIKEIRQDGHKKIYIKTTSLIDSLFTNMNRTMGKPIHFHKKPIHENELIKTTNYNIYNNMGSRKRIGSHDNEEMRKIRNNIDFISKKKSLA